MLRGQAENELIGTLDWHGEGTIQVDGQPCTTTKLRVQANYQIPGYRTQIECRRANGQTYSNVETLNGTFAWDEDRPGAEIVAGEGKATRARQLARRADDPLVGQPAWCGEGCDCGCGGSGATRRLRDQPRHAARSPGRSRSERLDYAGLGGAVRDPHVPDPVRHGRDGNGDTRRDVLAGRTSKSSTARTPTSGSTATTRTSTTRCTRSKRCGPPRSSSAATVPSSGTSRRR